MEAALWKRTSVTSVNLASCGELSSLVHAALTSPLAPRESKAPRAQGKAPQHRHHKDEPWHDIGLRQASVSVLFSSQKTLLLVRELSTHTHTEPIAIAIR